MAKPFAPPIWERTEGSRTWVQFRKEFCRCCLRAIVVAFALLTVPCATYSSKFTPLLSPSDVSVPRCDLQTSLGLWTGLMQGGGNASQGIKRTTRVNDGRVHRVLIQAMVCVIFGRHIGAESGIENVQHKREQNENRP